MFVVHISQVGPPDDELADELALVVEELELDELEALAVELEAPPVPDAVADTPLVVVDPAVWLVLDEALFPDVAVEPVAPPMPFELSVHEAAVAEAPRANKKRAKERCMLSAYQTVPAPCLVA